MGSALGTKAISLALTLLAFVGFVATVRRRMTVAEPMVALALAMIILWPFWTFRFVLPLVPFIFIYFVTGLEAICRAPARFGAGVALVPATAVRMFMFVLIGLNVLDHTQYIATAYGDPNGGEWKKHAVNVDKVITWVQQNGKPDGAIAADNPALVYLRTGRRTIAIDTHRGSGDRWKRWERMGVRYIVSLSDGALLEDRRATLRFKLEDENVWAFELERLSVGDLNDPELRPRGLESELIAQRGIR
jgi:hypothetical protein